MTHISLTEGLPGIRGPMVFSPETIKPLSESAQALLTGPNSLYRENGKRLADHGYSASTAKLAGA